MVKIVIIMNMAEYGPLADDVQVEEFNIAMHLHTEDMIMIQTGTPTSYHPAAVTYQTRFMRLVANVTLTQMSRNIVSHSVNLTNKY